MEAVRRSNSLDLGKSTRFDFGVDRNRNDSGCFEDFDVMNVAANHDPVVTYWEEAVYQWSERARSVIAQEVVRMNDLNKQSKRDLVRQEDREKVHKAWKLHMRETMDLAMDLIKCVSYDILEEFGCEPAPSEDYRRADKYLGKITEEESYEEPSKNSHGSRVFIIRVDHRIRRTKPLKRRHTAKSPFAKAAPRYRSNKMNKNTMTFLLEELKELRKMVGMKKSGESADQFWGCTQCLSNPTVWKDTSGASQEESVEDIFRDWVRMLHKTDIRLNSDINDVFWDISTAQANVRTRRLSEVLDDMHFGDRPDIFQDRCEILEGDARVTKQKPAVKSYWNIFSDWKNNLNEPMPSMSEWKVLERKKNAQNVGKKMRTEHAKSQEDYFDDWRFNLELDSSSSSSSWHRRRSVEEMEDDDLIILSSPTKKIKHDIQEKKRGVKAMAYKFGRAYLGMKRNYKIALGNAKLEDNFDFWSSNSTVESLVKSRNEFCQLRLEMRKQRQVNREMNEVIPPESWFEDWRWNLNDEAETSTSRRRYFSEPVSQPEHYTSEWRQILITSRKVFGHLRVEMKRQRWISREMNAMIVPEALFEEWRWNLNEELVSRRRRCVTEPTKMFSESDINSNHRRMMVKSRNDFENLRKAVQKQREINRVMTEIIVHESWFEEWRWNMDRRQPRKSVKEEQDPEILFAQWKCHLKECSNENGEEVPFESLFHDWRWILDHPKKEMTALEPEILFAQWRWNLRDGPEEHEEMEPESLFHDWNWRLGSSDPAGLSRRRASDPSKMSPEEIFSDWRRISLGSLSLHNDAFTEWMKNLKERVVKRRPPKHHHQTSPESNEMKDKVTTPQVKSSSKSGLLSWSKIPDSVLHPTWAKKLTSSKHPQTGKPNFDKKSFHLLTKCHAKQPHSRGRN